MSKPLNTPCQLCTDERFADPATLTMSSLNYLCLPAVLLLISQGSASPILESSGEPEDFLGTTQTPKDAVEPNLEPLALFVLNIATEQCKWQLCDYFIMCNRSKNTVEMYKMDLPQIRKKDKCFQGTFQKKKCLSKILKGLQEYKKYLLFVSQWIKGNNQQVDAMLSSTMILADLLPLEIQLRERIAQQVKNNGAVFNLDQSSKKDWHKQVAIHIILKNFALFMENTVRVIRYIKLNPTNVSL